MSAKTARPVHLGLLGAAALLIVALIVAVLPGSRPAAAGGRGFSWVTSWSASAQVAAPGSLAAGGFDDRTVRDIIFTSAGGDPIRLELTNAFGSAPLRVGRVTVAVAGSGAAVAGQVYPASGTSSCWRGSTTSGSARSRPTPAPRSARPRSSPGSGSSSPGRTPAA